MGKGQDKAKELDVANPELAQILEDFRDQLLIVFVERLGGRVDVPIAEADGTGRFFMTMHMKPDRSGFIFTTHQKQV